MIFGRALWASLLFATLLWMSACGGTDDRTNCMEADCRPDTDGGLPDGNPTNPDGNTTPDGNGQPDGNTDVCAGYQWIANKMWDCDNNNPYSAELSSINGACYIKFPGLFWLCSTTDSQCQDEIKLMIAKEETPARVSFTSQGGFTTSCWQRQ